MSWETPPAHGARANLCALLEELGVADEVTIEELDVVEQPEQALAHGIITTPAVVCIAPDGNRQILYGDLGTEPTGLGLLHDQLRPSQ